MRKTLLGKGSKVMKRWLVLAYGVVCYACFFGTFLYLAGWMANLVPDSMDGEPGAHWAVAAAVNLGLVLVFGIQHSVMARPAFKRWWTQWVPVPMERSTYVMATNLALWMLFWAWQPMGLLLWDIQHPIGRIVLFSVCVFGWLTVLITTFLINHFDLFGLRQVWLFFRGKPYTPLPFSTPGPYHLVRHPLYVGWMIAFWATPTMSIAHFLFALSMTAYMLLAIPLEERDLVAHHGERYQRYRQRVAMLVPGWRYRATGARKPQATHSAPIS